MLGSQRGPGSAGICHPGYCRLGAGVLGRKVLGSRSPGPPGSACPWISPDDTVSSFVAIWFVYGILLWISFGNFARRVKAGGQTCTMKFSASIHMPVLSGSHWVQDDILQRGLSGWRAVMSSLLQVFLWSPKCFFSTCLQHLPTSAASLTCAGSLCPGRPAKGSVPCHHCKSP